MCTIELLVLFLVLKTAAYRRHIFEVVDSVPGMQQRVSLYSHKEAQVPELKTLQLCTARICALWYLPLCTVSWHRPRLQLQLIADHFFFVFQVPDEISIYWSHADSRVWKGEFTLSFVIRCKINSARVCLQPDAYCIPLLLRPIPGVEISAGSSQTSSACWLVSFIISALARICDSVYDLRENLTADCLFFPGLRGIFSANDAQVHRQHLQVCLCDVTGDRLETLRWVVLIWEKPTVSGLALDLHQIIRQIWLDSSVRINIHLIIITLNIFTLFWNSQQCDSICRISAYSKTTQDNQYWLWG